MLREISLSALVATSIFSLIPAALADGMSGSLKDAPPPPETYVWSGPYIAAGIGAGRIDSDITVTSKPVSCFDDFFCADAIVLPPPAKKYSNDDWDVFGTLQIGYDRLLDDRLLIGAFADIDFYGGTDHSFSGSISYPYTSIKGNFGLDHIWSIGARIGVLVHPDLLVYVDGGYSRADVDGTVKVGYNPAIDLSDNLNGWFLGGGFERKLRRDVSLKFEYRYTDFDDATFQSASQSCGYASVCYQPPAVKADLDVDVHSIRAVIVLKLDEPEHAAPAPLK